ncbi:MAG: PAS domain S-box protein [Geobacteraceae bacterium]|nr:PAS domain S-box protein [Geobacteraceae bacterium]
MKTVKRTKAADKLRCRAEQQLTLNPTAADASRLDDEPMRLLHELQVHQVELEMQNSELLQTRDRLETALEKYTDLYDFAPVCYITLTHAGEISAVNLAGASLLGGVRCRLIGRKFGTFVAAADRTAFAVFLDTVLTGRIKESCELVLLNKRKQPVIVQIEAMATASGQEFRLALIDITGRKNLEAHLMQAEKMETVVLLAGGIARDINDILHVIVGYGACSEMNMTADDPLRVNLDQIIAAADRGANLTKSLLNFSRMQPVNPLPVDVNEIIRDVESFLSMVTGEGIHLEIACSEQRLEVTADRGQLEQVIISLATNARHAMPGGGRLSILIEAVDIDNGFIRLHGFGETGKYAMLSVTDNGTGMDREIARKIFEPFFTSDNGTGTGLGLSIAYSIIRQHNGHIDVDSEPGKGTTFRIYLPLTGTGFDPDEIIPGNARS